MNKKIFALAFLMTFPQFSNAEEHASPAQPCQKALADGNFQNAVTLGEQAIKSFPNNRDSYLCLGRAQGGAGHGPESISALQTAEKLSSTPLEHVVALTLLGNQYKAGQAYQDAIQAYQKSIGIAQSDKNKRYEMIDLNLIGEALQESGDLKNALTYYEQGQKLAANDNERADSYAHLAALYSIMREHDQAIIYQIKAVVLEERSGDFDHYAHANLELGRIYLEAKQLDNAEKAMKKLLPDTVQVGDSYWEASVYAMQGRIKLAMGKQDEGKALIDQAAALARKIGADELAKDFEASKSQQKM